MYKKYFEGKKAAFFDLDGTIVKDTLDLKANAIQKTLDDNGYGYINAEDYRFDGYPFNLSWEVIFDVYEIKDKNKLLEMISSSQKNYLELIKNSTVEITEGFWDLVYELKTEKGFKLAMVTSSTREQTEILMEKLEIGDVFDSVVCGDEIKKMKPNPEIYIKAAKELNLKTREIVVFEDSVAGVESAKNANMDVIVIWNKKTPQELYKGKILDFMSDFTPLPGNLDETKIEQIAKSLQKAHQENR